MSEEPFGFFPEPEKVEVKTQWKNGVLKAYDDGKFLDFEIQAKDGIVKAHKLILCSAVPFFSGLNSFGGKEDNENRLVLENFAASTVKAALHFTYKGTNPFEKENNGVNTEEVLVLAEQWQLSELKYFAAVEIGKLAECSQHKEIAALADTYNEPYLKKVARYLEKKAVNNQASGSSSGSGSSSSSSKPEPKQPEALPLDA